MKKHIKVISTISDCRTFVHVEVLYQSHRRSTFGAGYPAANYFAHGVCRLISSNVPEYYPSSLGFAGVDFTVFMLGDRMDRDSDKITIPVEHYQAFKECVEAYNAHFSE